MNVAFIGEKLRRYPVRCSPWCSAQVRTAARRFFTRHRGSRCRCIWSTISHDNGLVHPRFRVFFGYAGM